jgi:hypothetical protein
MAIKVPDTRIPLIGGVLLALWVAWSVYASFFTRPSGETWSTLHRLCVSGYVGPGRVNAIISSPYWSAECSRIHAAYTISTATFWIGVLLVAWYFGAKVLNAILTRPATPAGGEPA